MQILTKPTLFNAQRLLWNNTFFCYLTILKFECKMQLFWSILKTASLGQMDTAVSIIKWLTLNPHKISKYLLPGSFAGLHMLLYNSKFLVKLNNVFNNLMKVVFRRCAHFVRSKAGKFCCTKLNWWKFIFSMCLKKIVFIRTPF